jgi:hypothetical protein
MVTTSSIKLATHLDEQQVMAAASALRVLAPDGKVSISFERTGHSGAELLDTQLYSSAQRSALFWPAVLANLLLVAYGDLDLTVNLPWEDNRTMSLLERTGLPYALARRTGPTAYGEVPGQQELSDWLDPARLYGERSAKPFEELVGEGEKLARATQPKKRLLPWMVADPHLHYRGGDELGALPYAWLEGIVPKPENYTALAARDQLVPLLRGIMKELVENSARHAFLREGRSADRPDLLNGHERSCAVVSLTEGGESSADRLHTLIADTGVGITATLLHKYPHLRHYKSTEVLDGAITGVWSGIPNLPQALLEANNGLRWCSDTLARYAPRATFTLVTEDNGGLLIGAVDGANRRPVRHFAAIPFRGTLGLLSLELPRGLESSNEDSKGDGSVALQLQTSIR